MASPTARRQSIAIDLVSDESSDDEVVEQPPGPVRTPAAPPQQQATLGANDFAIDDFIDFDGGLPGAFPVESAPPIGPSSPLADDQLDGEFLMIDGEQVFIPNSPPPQVRTISTQNQRPNARENPSAPAIGQPFTIDDCLSHVLAVFPDVCPDHVRALHDEIVTIAAADRVEHIVNQLLSKESYPKRNKGKKRKREEAEEEEAERKRWEGMNREVVPGYLKSTINAMLKAEFPEASNNFIAEHLQIHRHLYPTFIALAKSKEGGDKTGWRGRPPKGMLADADIIAANSGWDALSDELKAARKQAERLSDERRAENAKKIAEQENLRRAIEAGETAECQACFEDLPMNRQIHCNGDIAHFTCYDCAETYIKSEVGDSRCRVLCTAGCGAGFAHEQLHQLSDKSLLEKLELLQQEKDIRDAGLDDLEECPFCDYKAILPPVEEDFEFRCMNPLCEKTSCRRCKSVSHIPITCEQYAKDNKMNVRHKIEEAMTAAMIRSCNKCKKQFIKEYGCNKMSCPSCGNLQCYVCSDSLKSYDHFDQGGGPPANASRKKCPLYDNVEERHEREVKEAEAAARAAAMSENPDVSEKDLEIKVSDAVKEATKDRIQRAAAVPGGVPAPPGFGGLFARMPRLGRYLDLDEADDDEDFDNDDLDLDDEDLFEARRPQRRQNARNGMARLPHLFEQEPGRQAAPAVPVAEPHIRAANARLHLADPRLDRWPAHLQAPYAPMNPALANPPLPQMQGFIPVFGYRPQMPRAMPAVVPAGNPPAAQPLEQAQLPAVAYRPPHHDLFQGLEGHLFGDAFGNEHPGGLAAVPPLPAAPPQAPPQVGVGHGADALGEAGQMHNRLHRAQQIRIQQQQRLLRQQQAQALQQQHLRQHGQDYQRLAGELHRAQRAQIAAMFRQQRQAEQQQQAGADLAQQRNWTWNGGPHTH